MQEREETSSENNQKRKMKTQNKFIFLAVLILSIFLISQFFDFILTGETVLNLKITKDSSKISNTTGNFNEPLDNSDLFGFSVASIGDLDGDNITDIVVGALGDDDGGSGRGAVYVLFMNTNGTVNSSQKISNTTGNFNEILDDFDEFGISVASIGDLDSDGVTDIVVGADGDDDGGSGRGAVYVLFMNANGTVKSSQKISNTTGNFNGLLDDQDQFGSSVTSIGDLNGDNITDIVVGADGDDDGGSGRGAVYVLFMNTNGTVNSSQKISDTQGNFNEVLVLKDNFGSSVTSIGDLNGDNITDIVVGANKDDDGGTDRGAVYILFMNTNGTVKSSQKISNTTGNFNEPLDDSDLFGSSVTSIGDLDNDNITDIVVGAYLDDDGGSGRGAVYVLFMNTNGTVKSSQKISNTTGNFNEILDDFDEFGISVASIGDLDSDGVTDIVVGADGDDDGGLDRGAVYVLFLNEVDSPNITLNSPTNNSNLFSSSVIFNRTVVDQSGIINVSLILDGIYNETNSSGINNTDYIFIKTLSEGTHNWTYEACDTLDNCVNATVTIFTVEVDITNPTAVYTCLPSIIFIGDKVTCTCSGSDSGGINTTSSPTTIIVDEGGSFTISGCTVTDNAGNSASATGSYTVIGGGGGGLDLDGPSIKKIHLLPSVNPGEETKVEFDSGTGIKEIQIQVSSKASNVRIKVSKYDSKPAEVSKDISGKVYRYLEISTENLENKLEKVIVTIQVEKTWISDQGLNKEDVKMFKFDNSSENWNELETIFDSEDTDFHIYNIELDSLSFFVIGEKVKEKTGEIGEKPLTEKGFFESIREKVPIWLWWSLVFVLVVGILLIIYFIRKKREEEIYKKSDDLVSLKKF